MMAWENRAAFGKVNSVDGRNPANQLIQGVD